jgi:7-cyano-7-deazaguanine synthase
VTSEGEERRGAVVLLSGGLDSTVAAALSAATFRLERGLFFDYGQRAVNEEFRAAGSMADRYGVPLDRIELPWMGLFSGSTLIPGKGETPDQGSAGSGGRPGPPPAWVENRNGVFVAIGASVAASTGCSVVVTGFNAEEAEDYPDNSERYIEAVNRALQIGTSTGIEVVSPTIRMTKGEIVREGLRLGIPWSDLWSCYMSGKTMCGRCESCLRLGSAVAGTAASDLVHFERKQV